MFRRFKFRSGTRHLVPEHNTVSVFLVDYSAFLVDSSAVLGDYCAFIGDYSDV